MVLCFCVGTQGVCAGAFTQVLEFSAGAAESSAGKKLESICLFGCRLELADGPIAIPGMRFISFLDFYFWNRITFSTHDDGPSPNLPLSPLNILLFHATCTPSVFNSPSPPYQPRIPFPPKTLHFIPSGRTLENRGIRKWRLC